MDYDEKANVEEVEFERWLDPYEFIYKHPEDVWVKYTNLPEKTLKHIFKIDAGSVPVRFQLAPPTSEEDTETAIIFNREPDGQHSTVNVECLRQKTAGRNERNQRHGEKIRQPRNLQNPRTGHFRASA